jgi:glyoxylase-like metal-dependent hydrolase (beta-lactamase superfamily II)
MARFPRGHLSKMLTLVAAGLLLLIAPRPWLQGVEGGVSAQQRAAPPPPMVKENATRKISAHVYVILDDSVPLVPNVGIIVGGKATMVIDTGLGPRNAEAILREVAKVSKNTDLYLVTTHFHPEHAAGSVAFPRGTKFVVSRSQKQDLDELGLTTNEQFASRSATSSELLKDPSGKIYPFLQPDVVFDREHTVDLGGLRVRLLALGPTHTRGDTSAFVEDDRVLFAGDIVFNRAFLAFSQYSSGRTWLTVLDQLGALNSTAVVPSHGPMGDGSLIGQQREVLTLLQTRVRELKGQGKSADDTAQALVMEMQAKYPDWVGPNRVAAAARAFYSEL